MASRGSTREGGEISQKLESMMRQGQEHAEEGLEMAEGWVGWAMDTIKGSVFYLWEIGLIRYYVYIYGILASVPMGIFLAYMTATVTGTSGFTSVIWVLIQGSLTGLGLVVLVPVLIGCFFVAGFFWILYSLAAAGFGIASFLYRNIFGTDEDFLQKAQAAGSEVTKRAKGFVGAEGGRG